MSGPTSESLSKNSVTETAQGSAFQTGYKNQIEPFHGENVFSRGTLVVGLLIPAILLHSSDVKYLEAIIFHTNFFNHISLSQHVIRRLKSTNFVASRLSVPRFVIVVFCSWVWDTGEGIIGALPNWQLTCQRHGICWWWTVTFRTALNRVIPWLIYGDSLFSFTLSVIKQIPSLLGLEREAFFMHYYPHPHALHISRVKF